MTNEIDEFLVQNLGNNGDSNGSSSTRHLKLIGFFVNNRSSYSDQLTSRMEMIQVDVDDTKPNDTVNRLFR